MPSRQSLYDIVYMTGAPAAGKSSAAKRLAQRVPDLEIWEFGERLSAQLRQRLDGPLEQAELREKSGSLATPEDVAEVDRSLIGFVAERRVRGPVLIVVSVYRVLRVAYALEQVS